MSDGNGFELSVLIPVFNWDVTPLVEKMLEEMESLHLGQRIEIIVMDDGSSDSVVVSRNDAFFASSPVGYLNYLKQARNVGRSAIRNMLAAKARGRFLLFLDCDVLPDSKSFLQKYLQVIQADDIDVVCGGISYKSRSMKGQEYDYHAYLGNRKEVKPAAERNSQPWRHILTSNILVRKNVFQATSFDERFTGYGYEDIEWGVRLAEKFKILHIDNTASHLGLVTKAKAYDKMRNSVSNYLLLRKLCPAAFDASVISKLVRVLQRCSSGILKTLDHALKSCFLSTRVSNRAAFILYQLNFAVLLALASREDSLSRH